tara:strand:+ start:93 stop:473 length:381 start_codon:yes stop_codon:yes gene_type:complete
MINISQIVQDVIDGNENPLVAFAVLKTHAKELATAIKEIEDVAMTEASHYGEKKFTDHGHTFELRDGSRRHSFKHLDHWVEKNAELKAIETLAKQAATANATMVDDNGEIITPAQVTYTKPSIIVT